MTTTATARVVDRIDAVIRAAVLMGADDATAVKAAIAQLELLFRAPLTKHYKAQALATYAETVNQLRGEIGYDRQKGAQA